MHFFEQHILEFYKTWGRSLPWRKPNITPYEVWVSEIMLQQTQVSRVIPYFERFIERFPAIEDLAKTPWDDFLPYYAGLGYYRRGENMLKCAQTIVRDFGGQFPKNKKGLISLPGIGDYTASAILSFAYGEDHLAFDTNLQKVFGRYLHGNKKASIDVLKLEKKLQSNKQKLNGAIMDFANTICLNKPKCLQCPLTEKCTYSLEGGKNEIQKKKTKSDFPTKDAQVFLWLHKNHKEYYSPNPDRFEVFKLSAPINTRENIKEYFLKTYKLELAVRPPHKKTYIDQKPTLFINAQILLGEHEFGIFTKNDTVEFLNSKSKVKT